MTHVRAVDPFDLPEWLGTEQVTWSASSSVLEAARVHGLLVGEHGGRLRCDLLAVDCAFPQPVADDAVRHQAHQAWRFDQVHLLSDDQAPVVLAVPGSSFDADLALDCLERFTRAVGACSDAYLVSLRLGARAR